MNFNPDFSEDDDDIIEQVNELEKLPVKKQESAPSIIDDINKQDVTSMSNLMKITLSHMEDDKRCREEINVITDFLSSTIPQMSIKELTEYYKAKVREREFHTDCVFKAYHFIQKTELAREMLIGSDRKERVIEAVDRTNIVRLIGMLNLNSTTEKDIDDDSIVVEFDEIEKPSEDING